MEPDLEDIVQNATKEELGQFLTSLEKELGQVQEQNRKLKAALTKFSFTAKLPSGKILPLTGHDKTRAWEVILEIANKEEVIAPAVSLFLLGAQLDPDLPLIEQKVTEDSVIEVTIASYEED